VSDRDALGNLLSKSSVGSYSYPASGPGSVRPHAATAAGSNSYSYDANGNMTTRVENGVTYQQAWDAENRLAVVTNTITGAVTRFAYDGDGNRVWQSTPDGTMVYIGEHYEEFLPGVWFTNTLPWAFNLDPAGPGKTTGLTKLRAARMGSDASPSPTLAATTVTGERTLKIEPARREDALGSSAPEPRPLALGYALACDDNNSNCAYLASWSYSDGWSVVSDAAAYGGAYHLGSGDSQQATLTVPGWANAVAVRFGPAKSVASCNNDTIDEWPFAISVDGNVVWSSWSYGSYQEVAFGVSTGGHTVRVTNGGRLCERKDGSISVKIASVNIDAASFQSADTSAPTSSASRSCTLGTDPWCKSNASVTLSASDNWVGVAGTYYRIDGGSWQTYSGAFAVNGEGVHTVEYYSKDRVNNQEAVKSLPVKIDWTPPTTSASVACSQWGDNGWCKATDATVTLSASDSGSSGLPPASTYYRVDGGSWQTYASPFKTRRCIGMRRPLRQAASDNRRERCSTALWALVCKRRTSRTA